MKIASTYANGEIFQHFGHTQQFKVYEVEDGKIVASKIIGSNGAGHGALAGLLSQSGIDVLICGGIGGGAINALGQAGIEVYAGAAGSPDAAVEALLAGALPKVGKATCHSDHAHSHSCANHGGTCHQ
ncbi:NifB/NifX family molybdenum-iron cluster-binding protein [Slackia isoflavoniconvertens]|uniref:NifB/NifX family molybdenum-iron cluster-binding protein n=1 Tax=Slackia isoflavoniconvertens TaxID=572010 RepID=UPI003AF1A624